MSDDPWTQATASYVQVGAQASYCMDGERYCVFIAWGGRSTVQAHEALTCKCVGTSLQHSHAYCKRYKFPVRHLVARPIKYQWTRLQ